MTPERLGAAIRMLRTNRGMTQQVLAKALHVTDKAVSKWERGLCVPDICLFPSLAGALGVSVADLLVESSNDETPSHLCQIYEKSADVRSFASGYASFAMGALAFLTSAFVCTSTPSVAIKALYVSSFSVCAGR